MKFLNPAGLLLLLALPVLIFIYLIRAHHEDRAVSSTFMWKLSERFMKKRIPLQKLQKFLLFALQLLLLICTSLMVARPAIITGKSTEYVAIIDGSASMQTVNDRGESRFDRALEQASELAQNISKGHRFSVILATDNASFLIQSSDSIGKVRQALDNAQCGSGSCDVPGAMNLAQQLCNRGESRVVFYTDSPCDKRENVELEIIHDGEWDVSVDSVYFSSSDDSSVQFISADVTSHNRSITTDVGLNIDGVLQTARRVELLADLPVKVDFPLSEDQDGSIYEVYVRSEDGLALNDSYMLCTDYSRTYNVLLASESPLYLESVLNSLDNCLVNCVSSLKDVPLEGYDLYVFDHLYPQEYPTDGSVLQFGALKLPEGLSAGKIMSVPAKLTKTEAKHVLCKDTELLTTSVSTYTTLISDAQWENVLNCVGVPVCMTRVDDLGLRQTVVSFDLHDSNLPLQADYVALMRNIVENSVFDLIPAADFSVGQTLELAVLPQALEMHLVLPDETLKAMVPAAGKCTTVLTATGLHTAVVTTPSGGEFADFFVHIPENEVLCKPHTPMSVALTESSEDAPDAISELWLYIAGVMLLLLILEWGVYYREQY